MNLEDASLEPEGWRSERPPSNGVYRHPSDMSVYELHIRDFSASDPQVLEANRGKYAAFADAGLGARHLRELQAAGLTHVHLLPAYDYGSVPEKASDQKTPEVSSLDRKEHKSTFTCRNKISARRREVFSRAGRPWPISS